MILIGLAALLLAAPASAAPRAVALRVSRGSETFVHEFAAEPNTWTEFAGPIGGGSMTAKAVLIPKKGGFIVRYEIELSGAGTFSARGGADLTPGARLRTVECGDWILDVSAGAGPDEGVMPAWDPAGPNFRVTAFAGGARCRATAAMAERFDVQVPGFGFDGVAQRAAGKYVFVQYRVVKDRVDAKAANNYVLGRRTPAPGGSAEILVEGPRLRARRVRPPLESGPPPEAPVADGPPALLR